MAIILVIDDEKLVRLTIRQALERDGHSVVEAEDGDDGLRKFRETEADIVITDILMPNKEGIQTIQEIRRIRPNIAIIAMSGGGRMRSTQFLDVAKTVGANAVMRKPFALNELRRAVNETLANKISAVRAETNATRQLP